MSNQASSAVLGTQQSPIDVITPESLYAPVLKMAMKLKYKPNQVWGKVVDDNFVLRPGQVPGLTFRGVDYALAKIHYHEECEHRIDGKEPANHEIHFIHTLAGSEDKVVLGVFFHEEAKIKSRPSLRNWYHALAAASDQAPCQEFQIELSDFIELKHKTWYLYQGSLTSYPFTEDITWIVSTTVEAVPKADVAALVHAKQTARVLMPLNRRHILRNFK